MSVFPGARWEPIPGHTDGPMAAHLGLVLHVNDADSYDLHDYFSRSDIEVSSHFQVTKDGTVFQYLDTMTSSWCQSDGNQDYLSVETQGFPSEPLTDPQVASLVSLYRWLHQVHGIPYQLANKPGERGFAWHGMGGQAWGGHFGCPGDLRRGQRILILGLASGQTPAPDGGLTMDQEVKDAFQNLHDTLRLILKGDVDKDGAPLPADKNTHPDNLHTMSQRLQTLSQAVAGIENKLGM